MADPNDRSHNEQFMRLFLTHERRVLSCILALGVPWEDASDLLQETAVTLWQKFDDFELGSNFLAWALSVARFRVLNYRKTRARARLRFTPECFEALADDAVAYYERADDRLDALRRCLDKLDARERELVRLRYQPGATTKSVAEALDRSVNSVYKLLNRIHRQLLYCIRATLETGFR